MNLHELSQQVIKHRWDRDFNSALDVYRNQIHGKYSVQEINKHSKLMSAIIDCLKETGKILEAVKMIEDFWKLEPGSITENNLLRNIAWAYFFVLGQDNISKLSYRQCRTDLILNLLGKMVAESDMDLRGMLFFRYCEWLSAFNPPYLTDVEKLLGSCTPENFSSSCKSITTVVKGQTKEVELASDQEKWLVLNTKVLFSLGKYESCINACLHCLEQKIKFHHGNQHWIARRLALSLKQCGNLDKAIHELEKLVSKRKEWFIEKELAEMYFLKKNNVKALSHAISAFTNQGYSAYKTTLFELLGDILVAMELFSEAGDAHKLAAMARLEQNWKVSESLRKKLGNVIISPETQAEGHYKQLLKKLQSISNKQQSAQYSQSIYHGTGIITRILNTGSNGDGFITDNKGSGYYFRFANCNMKPEDIHEQMAVSFSAKQIERKGKMVWNAIKVYQVKGTIAEK